VSITYLGQNDMYISFGRGGLCSSKEFFSSNVLKEKKI